MEPPMGLLRTDGETKARPGRPHLMAGAAVAETALTAAGTLGRAALVWSYPSGGLRAEAFGETERREGTLHDVLGDLSGPCVDGMPGPWFGAAAFDGTLGPDWSGFAPVRFVLPALLVWRTGG